MPDSGAGMFRDGGAFDDTGAPDAADADAVFACGGGTCGSGLYCNLVVGGDGGVLSEGCNILPNQCGSTPDCQCIPASSAPGCTCTTDGLGHVTTSCLKGA